MHLSRHGAVSATGCANLAAFPAMACALGLGLAAHAQSDSPAVPFPPPSGASTNAAAGKSGAPSVKVTVYEPGLLDEAKRKQIITACQEMGLDRAGTEISREAFKKLVRLADHPTIMWAIQEGYIRPECAHRLADWRILLRLEQAEKFLAARPDRALRVVRSDTGGQANGYSHDMDETYFVQEFVNGQWVRRPDLEMELVRFIETELGKEGLSNRQMKISSMPGAYRFLDDRTQIGDLHEIKGSSLSHKTPEMLMDFAHEALARKGVYALPGAVGQFMAHRVERQAYQAFELDAAEEPREITLPELQQKIRRLSNQVCTVLERPAGGPAEQPGWRPGTYNEVQDVILSGLDAKKRPGWAYDMAVAGWCEISSHVGDMLDPGKVPPVSQILRSVSQGPGLVAVLNRTASPFEYELITGDGPRRDCLRTIYGDDIAQPGSFHGNAPAGTSLLDRWKPVLDICAELRLRQRNPSAPITQDDLDAAFQKLAEQLAGREGEHLWRDFLPVARREFTARVQEIAMRNIVQTSRERILEWISCLPYQKGLENEMARHLDVDEIRRAYGVDKSKWKKERNFQQGVLNDIKRQHSAKAFRALFYSFRTMNQEILDEVLRKMEQMPELSEANKAFLRDHAAMARKPYLGLSLYREFPELLKLDLQRARIRVEDIGRSIMEHIAHEIGWIDTSGGQYVPNPLTGMRYVKMMDFPETGGKAYLLDFETLDRGVQKFFRKNNTILGRGARFLHGMVWDPGTLNAVTDVLKTFSESRGDPEALEAAVTEQIIGNLPAVGQIVGFIRAGSNWERAQSVGLMVVAWRVPGVQPVMVLYGLAEGGVYIYYTDYRMPCANAAADACYRGFVGPALYEFGPAPAQFTDEDEALHARLVDVLEHVEITKENARDTAQKLAKLRDLEDKKVRWNGYVIEQSRYEGGVLTGTAEQNDQKLLDLPADLSFAGHEPIHAAGPLLARVKPYVLYTSRQGGTVKFYLPELTPAQTARMAELETAVGAEPDPVRQMDLAYELDALKTHQAEWERAQHYLVRAGLKPPGPNDPVKKPIPELAHQIRIDSLFPYILEDTSRDMMNPERFVTAWFAFRSRTLPPALEKIGVKWDDRSTVNASLRVDTKAEIVDRLTRDVETSRQRWTELQRTETAQKKMLARFGEQGKTRVAAEGTMIAVERDYGEFSAETKGYVREANLDPKLSEGLGRIGEAISNRNRPLSRPEVRFGALFVKGDPAAKEPEKRRHAFRPLVTVVADPFVYEQPWSYAFYQLDRKSAQAAVAAKQYRGLPLDAATVQTLQDYLDKVPAPRAADQPALPAFLVFAFCADVQVPARVAPWTSADLPRLQRYSVPDGGAEACLLGGAAFWSELERPAEVPAGLRVSLRKFDGPGLESARQYFLSVGEPVGLPGIAPYRDDPAAFDRICAVNVYRKFERPQADEDWRFRQGNHGLDVSAPSGPVLFRVSPADASQCIGSDYIEGSYRHLRHLDQADRPPTPDEAFGVPNVPDPADLRVPRWYSYSVVEYRDPLRRPVRGTDEMAEGPRSAWVRCDVEPVIGFHDPSNVNHLVHAETGRWVTVCTPHLDYLRDVRFDLYATVNLDGRRAWPLPGTQGIFWNVPWHRVYPGRYVFQLEFGGKTNRSWYVAGGPGGIEPAADFDPRLPPGQYPLTIRVDVDGRRIAGQFLLVAGETPLEQRNRERVRTRGEQEYLPRAKGAIQNLAQNKDPKSRAFSLLGVAQACGDAALFYFAAVGDLQQADDYSRQAAVYADQAAAADPALANRAGESIMQLVWPYERRADVCFLLADAREYVLARQKCVELCRRAQQGARSQGFRDIDLRQIDAKVSYQYGTYLKQYFALTGDIAKTREIYDLWKQVCAESAAPAPPAWPRVWEDVPALRPAVAQVEPLGSPLPPRTRSETPAKGASR